MDFTAIRSAGKSIKRVRKIKTEVQTKIQPDYQMKNVSNSLEHDWKPWMKELGYRLTLLRWNGEESEAFWELQKELPD